MKGILYLSLSLFPLDIFLQNVFCSFNKLLNLYEFNAYYNLDIIEFVVLHKEEGKNNLFLPTDHKLNHFHNYSKNII